MATPDPLIPGDMSQILGARGGGGGGGGGVGCLRGFAVYLFGLGKGEEP